jgi:hypothetical protein
MGHDMISTYEEGNSIKGGRQKLRSIGIFIITVLLLFSLPKRSYAGAYIFAGETYGVDLITHPLGYNGTGGELTISVGIDPTSANAADMQIPLQNMVNVFNQITVTTGNLFLGGSNNIPSGQIDFESVALHELGHALGLAHPNLASESGLPQADQNYTKSTDGTNNTYNINTGGDGIKGSYDDVRGDDVNLHWFKIADNDPFTIDGIVDSTSYSRDLVDLPLGDTFTANADRTVGSDLGYPDTEAVMQQLSYTDEAQRTLTADDVATLRYGMSGIDEIEGTGDDYFVTLTYAGLDAGADIVLDFDNAKTGFAVTQTGGTFIGGHVAVTSADIYFNTGYNWFFNDVLANPNIPPLITGQISINTPEETARAITLADLTVTDPDNVYPADFSLSVQNGANYSRSGNTITPVTDFNGSLTVPVTVNDGTDYSNVYNLSVGVTPLNDQPVITGQDPLSTPEVTSLNIVLNDLDVTDPDNTFPDDFTLSVQDGANYSCSGNEITPSPGFNGTLTVPVIVNDGTEDSGVYDLSVEVTVVSFLYVEPAVSCGGNAPCYAGIHQAIDAAGVLSETAVTIYVATDTYIENIDLNISKDLTLQGGWDVGFASLNPANPAIVESVGPSYVALTATDGTVIIENLILQ